MEGGRGRAAGPAHPAAVGRHTAGRPNALGGTQPAAPTLTPLAACSRLPSCTLHTPPRPSPPLDWRLDEPHHRLVLENAATRVYDAVLAPGSTTLWHVHRENTAYVVVEPPEPMLVTNEAVTEGGVVRRGRAVAPSELVVEGGGCFCFLVAGAPLVHRLLVPPGGRGRAARIVGVEVLSGGPVPPAAAPVPAPYAVAGAGPGFRVLRARLGPGEAAPAHALGGGPAVVVTLQPGNVVDDGRGDGGGPGSVLAAAPKEKGGVAFVEGAGGGGTVASPRNVGDTPFEAVVVQWWGG